MCWASVPLSEVADVVAGQPAPQESEVFGDRGLPFIRAGHLTGLQEGIYPDQRIDEDLGSSLGLKRAMTGTVLFAKSGMSATKGVVVTLECDAYLVSHVCGVTPFDKLDSRFLMYWLRWRPPSYLIRDSAYPSIRLEDVRDLRIPLPPLPEQRRIAAILDKADAVRRKRQQTLDLADQFLRSAFLDMFGDPVTNPKGWPVVRLANLIDGPVRNGLSPSKSGTHAGEVLTLAAITGDQFRAERRKTAFFDIKPPLEKMVDARDFLICRGNGNIDLVGRACFPAESIPGVLFPDTMIGFRINTDTVAKAYLHLAWETKAVRNQIVTKSRTTSGIHKVNQQTLKTISLPLPPFEEQTRFEQLASKIHTTKKNLTSTDTDALLGSLVQRAFRGDL